ncbi:TetR/AcrR family transcriptional regulator [Massilia arenosa]|uniref:TetR/AcrR family transcriptional regulator n=1 Tax=Zemynaea arenosa TaxID=2561931 RepID=A0A4Y9SA09_9BURK|nr:TetR/AcrR family transcriptional regulator [Massilia arenosa]TFW18755.1 TetR/AcrR family transcriptional regulator [Massilia arenosa]
MAPHTDSRDRLLVAAIDLIRTKGYEGTRVDDVCAAAGVSKGSFFHHFKSKEALARAAAQRFAELAGALFAGAAFHREATPRARLIGYIDFRIQMIAGELAAFTCLHGMLSQETFATHPGLAEASGTHIRAHAATLVPDIRAARAEHAPHADWSAESLALHIQAVIQGSFVLAKSQHDPEVAAESLRHLRRYLVHLFGGDT